MAGTHIMPATAVRSWHLHAAAIALHVPATSPLRGGQGGRQCTRQGRREKRQYEREGRPYPGNREHLTIEYVARINDAIPRPS